ncbi:butyrophilin-like protein 2 [Aplochiton taeniatus]
MTVNLKLLCCLGVWVCLLYNLSLAEGQTNVVGSNQSIVAVAGDDVILPCHLVPVVSAADLTVEWTRPDLKPRYVHVHQDGRTLVGNQNLVFKSRTTLFEDELKRGNISLKLSRVQRSDEGRYRCFLPSLQSQVKEAFIQLRVGKFFFGDCFPGAVSIPEISILKNPNNGVDLQCESGGWYPEPEVEWLDSEGHVLSAGPTETVKDPDGTYTVRRLVTVEKTATNRFTCRVQQQQINQTRETEIHIPDEVFQSRSSARDIGIGVSVAVVMLIITGVVAWILYKRKKAEHDEDLEKQRKEAKEEKAKQELLADGKLKEEEERRQGVEREKEKKEEELKKEEERSKVLEEEKTKKEEELRELAERKREAETRLGSQVTKKETELKGTQEELQATQEKLRGTQGDLSGQSNVVGSLQPIVAVAGDDVVLPCHLVPSANAVTMTIEWSRLNVKPKYVHVHQLGRTLSENLNPDYKSRTQLFTDELWNGNVSLKLSRVRRSDEGAYKCYVPSLTSQGKESYVQLVVGAVSLPEISILKNPNNGVDLQCESGGWYPEPEVEWLDSEGHVLSAGPTETVKDPDGTYTVRRLVTVEKTATNRFTCRVQQQQINQTRETEIHIPDEVFQSRSSARDIGIGVSVAVVMLIITGVVAWILLKRKNAERKLPPKTDSKTSIA